MKKILTLTMALMLCIISSAENLNGKVKDANGQALSYVTVSVMTNDSVLVNGAITDTDGQFTVTGLAAKEYLLSVSFVGYQTVYLPTKAPQKDIVVTMREETEQLAEVEVKAKRPLIERHMDKLVLNVAASPFAQGRNTKEIMKKAPGVMIDKDGNITVNGKSVEVYIDGRPSNMSGEQLKAMMEGTDGSSIEKIEIISNPSAKYDASGQGGIINIKLKRNMSAGMNGTLVGGYGGMYFKHIDRYNQNEFLSCNLNYRGKKTYTYAQLVQVYGDLALDVESETASPFQGQLEVKDNDLNPIDVPADGRFVRTNNSLYDCNFQMYQLRTGNDWFIDDKNTLGFIVSVPFFKMKQNTDNANNIGMTSYMNAQGDTLAQQGSMTDIRTSMNTPQHSFNLNYTHVFNDSLSREITFNADYNRYRTHQHNVQQNSFWWQGKDGCSSYDGMDINTSQIVNIYSIKGDFQTAFRNTGMLESGFKYALSSTNNQMNTDSLTGSDFHINNSLLSKFDYNEHVGAAYISVGKQFGEHWSTKVGLRCEYAYAVGQFSNQDTTITTITKSRPQDCFFPTAFIGYTSSPLGKIAQPVMVNASFTRRIKRPSYYQLNPFVNYLDAHNYSMGSTELTPEFNNQVDVNMSWTQYLSMTFNFAHTQDMFSQEMRIMENGDGCLLWTNFGTCTTHGGNLSLTELPIVPKFATDAEGKRQLAGAWLALTVNASYFNFINQSYQKNDDGKPVYYNKNHWAKFSGELNAYLPKMWTLSVDGEYSMPMIIGYNKTYAQGGFSLTLRKIIPKPNIILNLQFQDVLRTSNYRQESMGLTEGYRAYFGQNFNQQKIQFTVVYNFGTYQQVKQRKVGNLDEEGRLGNGSSATMK